MSENTVLGDITPDVTPVSSDPTPAAFTPPAQSDMPEWLKGVDPEIAKDPSLKVFNNHQDLIKSYVHAQKMLGKDKTILPGKNSSDVEWKQFYQKLGVPSELDAYQINKGEKYVVNDEVMNEFKKLAHESNLLPNQAQKVMDWFNDKASGNMSLAQQQSEAKMTEGWATLAKEWGQGFDKNMAAAKAVIQEFGDEQFVNYLNESGLGDDPKLAQFLAKVGSNLKEDSFQENVSTRHGMTPQEAKASYTKIIGDVNHPYRNSSHPDHKNAVEEVSKLFAMM
jgi:hypothetical protein